TAVNSADVGGNKISLGQQTVPLKNIGALLVGGLNLTKAASVTETCIGGSVTYTYVATNTGNINLSGTVTDDNGPPGKTADDVTVGTFSNLTPGSSVTFTRAITITGSGTITNTATAKTNDGTVSSGPVQASVNAHTCTVSLTKTASSTDVCNGANTSITYSYVVTNNSDKFSAPGSASDDTLAPIGTSGPLARGAPQPLPKTATLPGPQTNPGTASAPFSDSASTTASATASATVTGHVCTVSLTKT